MGADSLLYGSLFGTFEWLRPVAFRKGQRARSLLKKKAARITCSKQGNATEKLKSPDKPSAPVPLIFLTSVFACVNIPSRFSEAGSTVMQALGAGFPTA